MPSHRFSGLVSIVSRNQETTPATSDTVTAKISKMGSASTMTRTNPGNSFGPDDMDAPDKKVPLSPGTALRKYNMRLARKAQEAAQVETPILDSSVALTDSE